MSVYISEYVLVFLCMSLHHYLVTKVSLAVVMIGNWLVHNCRADEGKIKVN